MNGCIIYCALLLSDSRTSPRSPLNGARTNVEQDLIDHRVDELVELGVGLSNEDGDLG